MGNDVSYCKGDESSPEPTKPKESLVKVSNPSCGDEQQNSPAFEISGKRNASLLRQGKRGARSILDRNEATRDPHVSFCFSEGNGPAVAEEEAGTHGSDGEVQAAKAASKVEGSADASDGDVDDSKEEEEEEAKPKIEVRSTPYDPRFPTTNQARHCYTRYNEFYRCIGQKSEDDDECKFYQRAYRSICPGEWVDKWNEQRENGNWAGKY